jgi:N-methylhydantoinase A
MRDGLRVGVDIGGTFTDFAVVDDVHRLVRVEKVLTSVGAAERSVLAGIDKLDAARPGLARDAAAIIHATTLVTNTILERKGARTGLVTTEGFRDLLEIQREVRYDIYDMFIQLPEPIVPRRLRIGVVERVLADGSVRVPLDEASVRRAAAQLRTAGVEAVAVVFLHSYRNPEHERRTGEILAEELPGVVISLSHEVHPEPKEYERTSTVVLDAYVKRVTENYLDRLSAGLSDRGYPHRLFVMLSNGGTTTAEHAKAVPIQLVESGPAAGVEAASFIGRAMGVDRLLSFDMGGTTAKLCIVEKGRAGRSRLFEVDRVKRFKAGSGLPVAVPVYDLLEIGAGGGSIARVDSLGLVQVGPDSAGAAPGPVCYGLGASEPTVTDTDLVLGYIDENSFLGGEMRLDRAAAEAAIDKQLASKTGMSIEQVAAGVHQIVNETMASAARQYVAEKGHAPSELTMVAFGGAGPVHAVGMARKLGCPRVIIPPFPGVMSALGLLAAPVAFERSQAVRCSIDAVNPSELEEMAQRLSNSARSNLPEDVQPVVRLSIDLCYSGQDHALEITVPDGPITAEALGRAKDDFVSAYHELYGKIDDDNPIELATLRVVLTAAAPELPFPAPAGGPPSEPASRRRLVEPDGSATEAPVYQRASLPKGQAIVGPALIEERETTTVLGRGDVLTVHANGSLVIALALPQRDQDTAVPRLAADAIL